MGRGPDAQPGAHNTTDDWSVDDPLAEEGYRLSYGVQRGDLDITEKPLPLIHLVLSNLKAWLNGVHHGVSRQHLQASMNELTDNTMAGFSGARWNVPPARLFRTQRTTRCRVSRFGKFR